MVHVFSENDGLYKTIIPVTIYQAFFSDTHSLMSGETDRQTNRSLWIYSLGMRTFSSSERERERERTAKWVVKQGFVQLQKFSFSIALRTPRQLGRDRKSLDSQGLSKHLFFLSSLLQEVKQPEQVFVLCCHVMFRLRVFSLDLQNYRASSTLAYSENGILIDTDQKMKDHLEKDIRTFLFYQF